MATDGPTPPNCRADIFVDGEMVCLVYGPSNAIERWVKSIAEVAQSDLDWHYVGGRGVVKHLGDDASRERTLTAIQKNKPSDPVGFLSW